MARDTFWRGGPGVTLPTWGHRPHHGILLAWGRGSPWAAPSSCSPFLAGAGFHGGGEMSIRALQCHPSVPKGRCPQVPHPGLIWDLLEPPQVTNSRRCHSPDRQGDMSPPPWGHPHHRWHHAGSMPWGMAAAGDTRSPAHVTLTCRGRRCSAVPKAWPWQSGPWAPSLEEPLLEGHDRGRKTTGHKPPASVGAGGAPGSEMGVMGRGQWWGSRQEPAVGWAPRRAMVWRGSRRDPWPWGDAERWMTHGKRQVPPQK